MGRAKKPSAARGFFIGAALGALGGAIAGILTAPKSGKATRADIKRTGKKAVTTAKKQVKKVTRGRTSKKTAKARK